MSTYYPEITLEVNQPFAIENPNFPLERPALATYAEGLHLIFYTDSIEADLPAWATETMAIGLTDFDSIPFMVLTFANAPLTFVYVLNVFGIIGDERGPWMKSTGLEVNVCLVDNKTGLLACVRSIETTLLNRLRHICREQWKTYADSDQVEIKVQELFEPPTGQEARQVTAQRIYMRSKLTNQIVVQYAIEKP